MNQSDSCGEIEKSNLILNLLCVLLTAALWVELINLFQCIHWNRTEVRPFFINIFSCPHCEPKDICNRRIVLIDGSLCVLVHV